MFMRLCRLAGNRFFALLRIVHRAKRETDILSHEAANLRPFNVIPVTTSNLHILY